MFLMGITVSFIFTDSVWICHGRHFSVPQTLYHTLFPMLLIAWCSRYSLLWHFGISSDIFHASMFIRHANDGKLYLYDILEIKKETSNPLKS